MILQTIHVPGIREISDIPQLVNTSLANKLFLPNKRFLRPEVTYQNDSPQVIYSVERRRYDKSNLDKSNEEIDKFREMDVFEVVHIPEREKVTAIVVEHQLEIHSVHIKSMDLNSLPKDTKIYVRPSIGVDTTLGKCWRLKRQFWP